MKAATFTSLIAVPLVCIAGYSSWVEAEAARPFSVVGGKCNALDGDTLQCGDTRVRLIGVDSAELPGHCKKGRDCAPGDPIAHKRAMQQFASRPLTVKSYGTDRYGRTLGFVTDDLGNNASCAAVAAGARYVAAWDKQMLIVRACFGAFSEQRHFKIKLPQNKQ